MTLRLTESATDLRRKSDMYIEDKDIHKGHRSRMRSKIESYGPRIFDTYELLEMLLYYVIPYKDTNPIAKRLLAAFGSLDGVFKAPISELAKIDGIGERCAEFISLAGRVVSEDSSLLFRRKVRVFDDYNDTGRFLVSYFEENDASACMMMLDGGMRLIGIEEVRAKDFTSAEIKPKAFVNAAILSGASVVIIAHKRHSLIYFSDGAIATDKMLRNELSRIGITVAEHYVVCGKDYAGMRTSYSLESTVNTPELERFYESIPDARRFE
jgi:DNA repair protein RadC